MMLALAHPMHNAPPVPNVEHPLRPQSSASTSSSRPARPPQRKLHSAFIIPVSSSVPSASQQQNAPTASASRSAPLESLSTHRAVSQRTPPSQPSQPPAVQHLLEDDDPHTPPASDSEDNEPVSTDAPSADVHSYDPETLLRMLATALKRIAELNASPAESYAAPPGHSHPSDQHNREHPPIWRTLTTASRHSLSTTSSLAFHARNVPAIALDGYLNRIHKYCPASNEVFVSLLVYLDRMTRMAKEACGRTFPIDMYNIHRLIIAGVTVASKFFSDVFYTNSRYAKVGGLPLAELNQLELQFLLLNDFRLPISVEEMQYFTTMVDLQSKIPDDVDLSPYLPRTPNAAGVRPPVGPSEFFAAVDAYCGTHHTTARSPPRQFTSYDSEEPALYPHSRRSSVATIESDLNSDAGTEASFDCSTDDEPTIRPPNSCADSETMSLRSAASDADSIFTNDEDMSRDEDSEDSMQPRAEGTPGREYMIMRTPS